MALFDELAAQRGATTNVARAELVGLNRSTFIDLRNGAGTSLDTALHMAEVLNTDVRALFEPVPDDEQAQGAA